MLRERLLLQRIRSGSRKAAGVVQGIGDDCAILQVPRGAQLLVTTDLCIENVHFRRTWHPPVTVGHRCLARGLSDIAAMGGEPLACFLSLGLPDKLPIAWVDGFLKGLNTLARQFGIELAGGDTSSAPCITADITVTGHVPAGKAVLRSGAKPGDRIYVTGLLGASAASLQQLYAGKKIRPAASNPHFYPQPRVGVGRWLRQHGMPTAMIDLSDGLSVDLSHICEESSVSATITATQIPIAQDADLKLALHGGEDYELLFTAGAGSRLPAVISGVQITEIGVIGKLRNNSSAILILGENGKVSQLPQLGWEHFHKKR